MHYLIQALQHPCETSTSLMLILQVKKLRPQENESFAFSALPISMCPLPPSSIPPGPSVALYGLSLL